MSSLGRVEKTIVADAPQVSLNIPPCDESTQSANPRRRARRRLKREYARLYFFFFWYFWLFPGQFYEEY